MGFFFNDVSVKKNKYGVSAETLHLGQCKLCPLPKNGADVCKLSASGTDTPLLTIIGEAPGREETERGEPFVGKSGTLLKRTLGEIISRKLNDKLPKTRPELEAYLKQHVRFSNVLRCHPYKNKTPEWPEIECCRPFLEADLLRTKPKVVVGTGAIPLDWFLSKKGILAWRGVSVPTEIKGHRFLFFPTVHPSYVERKKEGRNSVSQEELMFARDLERAVDVALELRDRDNPINVITKKDVDAVKQTVVCLWGDKPSDFERACTLLDRLKEAEYVGFDLETHSDENIKARKLRPYGKGAQILSIAFSDGTMPLGIGITHPDCKWTEKQRHDLWIKIDELLASPHVHKVAHNLAFELEWLGHLRGTAHFHSSPFDDTLAQAYVLGYEVSLLSLDVQCRLAFGFNLKDMEKVDVTNLKQTPVQKVLVYNALDAHYTCLLFKKQQKTIARLGMQRVYADQAARIPTMVLTQLKGLLLDQEVNRKLNDAVDRELVAIVSKLRASEEVKQYERLNRTFNPNSVPHVVTLLRDIMQRTEGYRGEDKYVTDESVLEKINHPITHLLLKYRELTKLQSTYITNLSSDNGRVVWQDGALHPQFNTCFVGTRRLSSEFPNCFSADTEVLTEAGWVRFDALPRTVRVAQYNLKNRDITFERPLGYVVNEFDGELLNIRTRYHIDLLCTADHEFYLLPDPKKSPARYKKVFAQNMPEWDALPTAGVYVGGSESWSEERVALIAAYQADAEVRRARQDGTSGVVWSFSKDRKIERLRWVLDTLRIQYTFKGPLLSKDQYGRGKDQYMFTVLRPPEWLCKYRTYGSWLLDLDRKTLDLFAREVWFWDGYWKGQTMFSSNNKENSDWVQILQILSNRRAQIRESRTTTGNAHWFADCGRNWYTYTTSRVIDAVPYQGKVYCCSMPQGTLIVRRNGRAAVVGNCQNFPARKNKHVRSQVVAPFGHYFLSCDYGQIEARVIAMASKDAYLVKALWERYDIHQEWAEKVAHIYPKALDLMRRLNAKKDPMKVLRQETKNKLVFPAFYGAYPKSISENFNIPQMIIEELLEEFWATFRGVKRWQQRLIASYQERGYVELLTGFRRYEPLEAKNAAVNTPVQGSASDIVVEAMNRLSRRAVLEDKPALQPILQIHDDISFYIPIPQVDEHLKIILDEMLGIDFDFINVPLAVEAEAGYDWYDKKPIGDFFSDKWFA